MSLSKAWLTKLMLNKVCFVAKTKMMVCDGVMNQMGFCVQSADQEPILILRQDVFINPLEHYNTWDIK